MIISVSNSEIGGSDVESIGGESVPRESEYTKVMTKTKVATPPITASSRLSLNSFFKCCTS